MFCRDITPYTVGNDEVVMYQIKSVYRFLSKIGGLHSVRKEILAFVRQLPRTLTTLLMCAFEKLIGKHIKLLEQPY